VIGAAAAFAAAPALATGKSRLVLLGTAGGPRDCQEFRVWAGG